MQYGITSWSSTHKIYLSKLSTLQNKEVKIIAGERVRFKEIRNYIYTQSMILSK